jgi:hypothetical protein
MARRHPIAVAIKQHAGEEARLLISGIGENATLGPNELGPFSGLNLR